LSIVAAAVRTFKRAIRPDLLLPARRPSVTAGALRQLASHLLRARRRAHLGEEPVRIAQLALAA